VDKSPIEVKKTKVVVAPVKWLGVLDLYNKGVTMSEFYMCTIHKLVEFVDFWLSSWLCALLHLCHLLLNKLL